MGGPFLVVVSMLASEGMSTRAIAPIVGVSNMTISNDLAGVKTFTPDPAPDVFDRDVAEAEAVTALH